MGAGLGMFEIRLSFGGACCGCCGGWGCSSEAKGVVFPGDSWLLLLLHTGHQESGKSHQLQASPSFHAAQKASLTAIMSPQQHLVYFQAASEQG